MRHLILTCIIVLFLGGCADNHVAIDNEKEEAKKTLITYLQAVNDNNYDEQLRLLTAQNVKNFEHNRTYWNIVPEYEYLKIINIAPADSKTTWDAQHAYGSDELLVFMVGLEAKMIYDGTELTAEEFKVPWKYILIKEDGAWKIYNWGY